MNNLLLSIFTLFFILGCSYNKEEAKDVRVKFGAYKNGQTLKWKAVDVTSTPIFKKIKHHPEEYTYLNKVEIYSIGHISDSLLVTGFMVVPKAEGVYPVIIFNRGGNQELGRLLVASAVDIMAPLAAQGYVVLATNYRGNSGGEGKEQFGGIDVNDVINLIKSSSELKKADTSKVGLLGISRGGMMNYLTMKNNNLPIKAIVNIGGITDLETTIKYHPEIGEVAKELIPGYTLNRDEEVKKRSVVNWVNELSADVPMLLLHSMEDSHVNYRQIPVFADSLDVYNLPYKLISFKHDKHGLINHKNEVRSFVANWFDIYLKEEKPFNEEIKREVINN